MSYSIRILPAAKEDRRSIFQYIERHSLQGAEAWEEAYEKALNRLRENPMICGLAPENAQIDVELRQILFKSPRGRYYRLLFRIDEEVVTIYRLRGPGQAPISPPQLEDQ